MARVRGEHSRTLASVVAFRQKKHPPVLSSYPLSLCQAYHPADTLLSPPADDDAFEPAEASPPTPGHGDSDGASTRCLEQPLPTAQVSLADLEDSADSSSALLVPPDPTQSGIPPATEALPGGGCQSRSSLNTVV